MKGAIDGKMAALTLTSARDRDKKLNTGEKGSIRSKNRAYYMCSDLRYENCANKIFLFKFV